MPTVATPATSGGGLPTRPGCGGSGPHPSPAHRPDLRQTAAGEDRTLSGDAGTPADLRAAVDRRSQRADTAQVRDGRAAQVPGLRDSGPRVRAPLLRPVGKGALCGQSHGFNLQNATRVAANDKDGRERLCRYILRPPLANDWLKVRDSGDVRLDFKRPSREAVRSALHRASAVGANRSQEAPHAEDLLRFG
jgi:hypothetical protein